MYDLRIPFLCVVIVVDSASGLVCNHEIFCHGRILHEVQMSSLYPDSKTFVDMKLKFPKQVVLKNFDILLRLSDNEVSRTSLSLFLRENFDDVASEFEAWTLPDIKDDPGFLDGIRDAKLKAYAKNIHMMWAFLARKIKDDVKFNPELYSIMYLPEPFVVPGGRFREIYYWDTFWICKGLLISEMYVTVRGMIKNYVHLVENWGLIPNGNRIYYKKRSQPPMLIPMVGIYHDFTKDFAFVQEIFPTLEKEFDFWRKQRSVTFRKYGKEYTMFRFYESSEGPRPESYKEDVVDAAAFDTPEKREEFFRELKAAAESGWDFTSRWFVYNASADYRPTLADTKVRNIVPVDLNCIVEWNARTLAKFCKRMNRQDRARYYTRLSRDLQRAIKKVLWRENVGAWLDYDFVSRQRRNYFYPSNLAPLWTQSFDRRDASHYVERVLEYLEDVNILRYPGGIPTSQELTGQQWDYPNTWAPLQDMVISGLHKTNHDEAQKLALTLAQNWITTNYMAYEESKAMYEKYDARVMGMPGRGGEYENQIGFGWTNGVALDFLHQFGNELVSPTIREAMGAKEERVEPAAEVEQAPEAELDSEDSEEDLHALAGADQEEEQDKLAGLVDHRYYEQYYAQKRAAAREASEDPEDTEAHGGYE
ncbi:trehalase-like [Bacillus rossius redtenbacheri]|uniref:trehalase-like n=1 Tax=Bacillus rossius redtenbacheri TaxID=93214 RepID=UPI002FDD802B